MSYSRTSKRQLIISKIPVVKWLVALTLLGSFLVSQGCQQLQTYLEQAPESDPSISTAETLNPADSSANQTNEQAELSIAKDSTAASAANTLELPTNTSSLKAENSENEAPKPITNLWDRVRSGFSLDLTVDNPRITSQLNWYKRHQDYLDRVTDRSSRYLHFIVEETEKRNMPLELALLPIVESAFDPFAYSHGRAAGMWQFIPSTGRIYGMKQTWWYDGRRDIYASTHGALDYLNNLQKQFKGDWLLALAAYNSGSGTVKRAIRRNKKVGKNTDFWSLKLPRETRAYVPKLIAIAKLVADPQKYNVSFKPLKNESVFAAVDTGTQLDLAQAADMAGISIETLYLFNPGFNRWATDPKGPHRLLLPNENVAQFNQALTQLPPEERLTWSRYKIKKGDTVSTIAKRHSITPSLLRSINNIKKNRIRAGDTLLIPTSSKGNTYYSLSANERLKNSQASYNKRTSAQKITYTVQAGDSFWEIAKKYKVGVRKLAKWNGMAPTDPLRVGKKLVIWSKAVGQAATDRSIVRKVNYKVRNGDSFARIANKFNVSINQIKRWNNRLAKLKYLQPGQQVTLFVDITKTR